MFGGVGLQEILPIVVIVLIIFGAKRMPEIGKGIGEGILSFRKALKAPVDEEPPKIEEKKGEAKEEAKGAK